MALFVSKIAFSNENINLKYFKTRSTCLRSVEGFGQFFEKCYHLAQESALERSLSLKYN
jgi:hypothetical protein